MWWFHDQLQDLLVVMVTRVPAPKINFQLSVFTQQERSGHKVQTELHTEKQPFNIQTQAIKIVHEFFCLHKHHWTKVQQLLHSKKPSRKKFFFRKWWFYDQWKDLLVVMVNLVPAPKIIFWLRLVTQQETLGHEVQTKLHSEKQQF